MVSPEGGLLQLLRACGERQQSPALDLAGHHEHAGLQGAEVAPEILRHRLRPLRAVVAVGQQGSDDLQRQEGVGGTREAAFILKKLVLKVCGEKPLSELAL